MIGIIFAAGIGSRLKPFTDSHPKALAPIAGTPAIVHVARKLVAAGARALIVNVHHFPQQVVDCLMAQPFADIIEISDESQCLLDTGGALAKIWRESKTLQTLADDEPIVVHNADIITDFPLDEMIAASHAGDATLLVDPHRSSTRHFLFDNSNRLRGWENTAKNITRPDALDTSGLIPAAFGGVHILHANTIAHIAADAPETITPFSVTDWYINSCNSHNITGFTPSKQFKWFDIGTPEKLDAANKAI